MIDVSETSRRAGVTLFLFPLLLATALPADYVLVPGGYMHESCVAAAPAPAAPCAHAFLRGGDNSSHGSAWKAWAQVDAPAGGSVTSLNSTWTVPDVPTNPNGGQTLFWWNGMEPEDTSAVLQPVLQWGSSAAGGGNYYAIASWYVSATHGSRFSPLVRVNAGEAVQGSNTLLADGRTWAITAAVVGGREKPSTLSFAPVAGAWPTAYHVLEAYGVTTDCTFYPSAGAVNFTVTSLAFDNKPAPTPINWLLKTQTAGCGEVASASDGGLKVRIAFHTA